MKLASIREFRKSFSGYAKKGMTVIITSHGKIMGCFLPFKQTEEVPLEFKKEFTASLGKHIAARLAAENLTEQEILDDFAKFKKTRRRQ